MATWLYQLSGKNWSPNRYRFEIWEGERWSWDVNSISKHDHDDPKVGDVVVFFYAKSKSSDPGFYGWGVILEWYPADISILYFRPTSPSDYLKMHPWSDKKAMELADKIRKPIKQGTLFLVQEELEGELRDGISTWLGKIL
jgi:hypothetical protein